MTAAGDRLGFALAAVLVLVLLPGLTLAQDSATGAISGVVTDDTGGVLPGVTVEARSVDVGGDVRTGISDGAGLYRLVSLRPGPYTIMFTLPGFSTVVREGIDLRVGFTATVNVEMSVGSIEETITVTGASPVVDIQNVRSQNNLTREVMDALPIAKNYQSLQQLTLGAMGLNFTSVGGGDVGGVQGEQMTGLWIHGGARGLTNFNGMRMTTTTNFYDNHRYFFNQLGVQEMTLDTGGMGADTQSGSLNVNMIPKEGTNTFSGGFAGEWAGSGMQGDNFSQELRDRGLARANELIKIYDAGVGFGGPLVRDRVWFYTAHRAWGSQQELAGIEFNALQADDSLSYAPDPDRPGFTDNYNWDMNARFTWQATPAQKLSAFAGFQDYCKCYSFLGGGPGRTTPESTYDYRMWPNNLFQATYTNAVNNRLLVEAGWLMRVEHHLVQKPAETGNMRSVFETAGPFAGLTYGSLFSGSTTSRSNYGDHGDQGDWVTKLSVSYITGSHAFKVGFDTFRGAQGIAGNPVFPEQYTFRNGIPIGLTQVAFPHQGLANVSMDLGIYAQDQWTIDRLTLNLGVRFDYLNAYAPAQTRPGGKYLGELTFPEVNDIPNWKDVSPRLGAAYDLFGDGKTAIKASINRYILPHTTGIANDVNPASALAASTNRSWTDLDGDFEPDCDLFSIEANGECGAMSNRTFGSAVPVTAYSTDVTEGFGVREMHWSASASVQQELRPGLAVTISYFRTWWNNRTVTDNRLTSPDDYDQFCITAPVDSRLPGGGGYQVCDLYEVRPERFGQVDNLIRQASDFGRNDEIYNGIEAQIDARFGEGGVVTGGISTGHTSFYQCDAPDFPSQFCETTLPWAGQTQVKFSGAYPLPWDMSVSASMQNLSGVAIRARQTITSADALPSLGRPLNTGRMTIDLMELNQEYQDRFTLLDVRLTKTFRVGDLRVRPRLDIYNLLNTSASVSEVSTFGGAWQQPIDVYGARMLKVGGQIDW